MSEEFTLQEKCIADGSLIELGKKEILKPRYNIYPSEEYGLYTIVAITHYLRQKNRLYIIVYQRP